MNIEKRVNSIVESTINDLVDGKYKLVEIGQFDSKLEYGGNKLEIWIANDIYGCKISSRVCGLEFPEFDGETKKKVYEIATTETDFMIKKELKKARKLQRDSYLKYKENVAMVKSLKEKLQSYAKKEEVKEC